MSVRAKAMTARARMIMAAWIASASFLSCDRHDDPTEVPDGSSSQNDAAGGGSGGVAGAAGSSAVAGAAGSSAVGGAAGSSGNGSGGSSASGGLGGAGG